MGRVKTAEVTDVRLEPAYDVARAARYIQMPATTLRAWASGQGDFKPVLTLPKDGKRHYLSFVNLVEAHVLFALRRHHRLPMQHIRKAIRYLENELDTPHPLATQRLKTDGVDLFIERLGRLVNASRQGQIAMRDLLEAHLRRVEWAKDDLAAVLYPFTSTEPIDSAKIVMINPKVQFGQLVLTGTGIPTLVIAQRYKAGEAIDDLASDYRRPRQDIEEAIRSELRLEAA